MDENKIAETAYRLWEEDGRPPGNQPHRTGWQITAQQWHWVKAKFLLSLEEPNNQDNQKT